MSRPTCQPPHIRGQKAPLFFIQVCAVLVVIRVVASLVLPLQTLQYSPGVESGSQDCFRRFLGRPKGGHCAEARARKASATK